MRVTEHIAAGAAFVPFNQPGLAANTLLSGQMVARATSKPSSERRAIRRTRAPTTVDEPSPRPSAAGGDA